MAKTLDVITIGRSSVDLYGDQIGGRLEDMGSFSKYIGGSPTNIACGTARLGLKSAVITGVGDEHMGRFIVEQLAREGVDTRGVKVDPERLSEAAHDVKDQREALGSTLRRLVLVVIRGFLVVLLGSRRVAGVGALKRPEEERRQAGVFLDCSGGAVPRLGLGRPKHLG